MADSNSVFSSLDVYSLSEAMNVEVLSNVDMLSAENRSAEFESLTVSHLAPTFKNSYF